MKRLGLFWRSNNGGVYDPTRRQFRTPVRAGYVAGVPDILGVLKGVAIGIEVKSETGKLSKAQKAFKEQFEKQGGVYIEARRIEDVQALERTFTEFSTWIIQRSL